MRLTLAYKGALIAAIVLESSFLSGAQAQPSVLFDVSSVKPAPNNSTPGYIRRLDTRTVAIASMTVYDMIKLFYDVKPYQISGGPAWTKRERFDVVGKDSTVGTMERPKGDAAPAGFKTQYGQMRQVLKDRFQLKVHEEVKSLPTLMLLANEKKKFTQVPCSSEYRLEHGFVKGAIRISSLTALLKVEYGMPVSDGTGLNGCYYIDKIWTNDPNDDSLPSIETSLNDLGFHLRKVTTDVSILVIDYVERPKAD